MVEVLDEFTERSHLLLCATVAEGGMEMNVPVRVLNISGNSVTIHKGLSLAGFYRGYCSRRRTTTGRNADVCQWRIQTEAIGARAPSSGDRNRHTDPGFSLALVHKGCFSFF